jgi:hypothetical protein
VEADGLVAGIRIAWFHGDGFAFAFEVFEDFGIAPAVFFDVVPGEEFVLAGRGGLQFEVTGLVSYRVARGVAPGAQYGVVGDED